MKLKEYFLISLLTIFLLPINTSAQQYHPFPEENAFWTVAEFRYDYWEYDTFIYTVEGDTMLNNKVYKKIYQLNDIPDSHDTLRILHNFMRQDTVNKKIWFIRHYQGETTEKLGYDFDVEIGDTVSLPAFDYANIGDSIFKVIEPIFDSTQLNNGDYRKNYFYASLFPPYGNLDITAIEGVGTQMTAFPNLFYFDEFHRSHLYCLELYGEFIYGDTVPYPICGFTVDIAENQESINISVIPNPSSTHLLITVSGHKTEHIQLQLSNIFGLEIIRQSIGVDVAAHRLNTSNIPNGIYILRLKSNSMNYATKIIVNH